MQTLYDICAVAISSFRRGDGRTMSQLKHKLLTRLNRLECALCVSSSHTSEPQSLTVTAMNGETSACSAGMPYPACRTHSNAMYNRAESCKSVQCGCRAHSLGTAKRTFRYRTGDTPFYNITILYCSGVACSIFVNNNERCVGYKSIISTDVCISIYGLTHQMTVQ